MTSGEYVVLLVNHGDADSRNLKELIEFMDTPRVRITEPEQWRSALGEQRLEALFVGPDLSYVELGELLGDIRALDPNVPIVMINADGAA